MSDWISVEDEEPKDHETVLLLVHQGFGDFPLLAYKACGEWVFENERYEHGDVQVNYWMPLPAPPKVKNDD